jgi:hypothetical protein
MALVERSTDELGQRTTALGGLIPQTCILGVSQGDLGTMHSDVMLHHLERNRHPPVMSFECARMDGIQTVVV